MYFSYVYTQQFVLSFILRYMYILVLIRTTLTMYMKYLIHIELVAERKAGRVKSEMKYRTLTLFLDHVGDSSERS